jgi:hypothetical protein
MTTSKDCQTLRLEILRAEFGDTESALHDIFTDLHIAANRLSAGLSDLGEFILLTASLH